MATPTIANYATDAQAEVYAFLSRGDAFGDVRPKRIDTHAASIFLAGDRAWKLKRAVRFSYLDFSTSALRHDALSAELRLNQRTSVNLYRTVHSITKDANGQLALDGDGVAIDWLLEMQRFPDGALFAQLAETGQLDQRLLLQLADRIVDFHSVAEIRSTGSGAERIRNVIDGNVASIKAFPDILNPEKAKCLAARLHALTDGLAALLDQRSQAGRVRHGHGDLHLANIALIDGEPTLFDCLEFSTELATIDVLYDLAFLVMDLWHRDLHTAANIVFNRYLDQSPTDESGLALMPLFLAIRAAIRAHVLAAQSGRAAGNSTLAREACSYLDLAASLVLPVPTRLLAIGGLSGTGKSSLARVLGSDLGRAPGARIFRNDVVRKRLAGLSPETRMPTNTYSALAAERVYRTTDQLAAAALACGQSVIADAVFAQSKQRENIEEVAQQADAPFNGIWLETQKETRFSRVATRGIDASDADADVVEAQSRLAIGDLRHWHIINADRPLIEMAAETQAVMGSM
jgi:aminoglycoside phosphotransferase family enzyme/predicted kinase